MSEPTCRHCGRPKVNRPRGLCWTCFYTPGVRDRYVSTSKFARRGVGLFQPTAMPEPTQTLPGTPERAAVYAARAEAGQCIYHPDDA